MSSSESPSSYQPIPPVVVQSEPTGIPDRVRALCAAGTVPDRPVPEGPKPFLAYLIYSPAGAPPAGSAS